MTSHVQSSPISPGRSWHRRSAGGPLSPAYLCAWLVTLGEQDIGGRFNAAGQIWTRAGLLWAIRGTTSRDSSFYWPSSDLVAELELPAPMLDWGEHSRTFDHTASLAAGMAYRPLADSVVDTLAWWQAQTDDRRGNPRGWPATESIAAALAKLRG